MKNKVFQTAIILMLLIEVIVNVNAQQSMATGPYISQLVLVPYPPQQGIDSTKNENRLGVEIKIENPELAASAVVVVKKRDNGTTIATITIEFIDEGGVINYVQNGRKRPMKRGYTPLMLEIGQEEFKNLTAEAYIIDKNGVKSSTAFF